MKFHISGRWSHDGLKGVDKGNKKSKYCVYRQCPAGFFSFDRTIFYSDHVSKDKPEINPSDYPYSAGESKAFAYFTAFWQIESKYKAVTLVVKMQEPESNERESKSITVSSSPSTTMMMAFGTCRLGLGPAARTRTRDVAFSSTERPSEIGLLNHLISLSRRQRKSIRKKKRKKKCILGKADKENKRSKRISSCDSRTDVRLTFLLTFPFLRPFS